MDDLQFWPTGTVVGLQTFGGGRLRFVPGDPYARGSRLEFEFARTLHDGPPAIHNPTQVLPPVRFSGPSIKPTTVPRVSDMKLYQVIQGNNRHLRTQHPGVDLPKSLLLEYILEDQEFPEKNEPQLSSLLTGLTIDEEHDVVVSVGGPLGNELYCTFIENGQSDVPTLCTTSNPATTLRTPVHQLASGPSLNQEGNAVFLARTHDATTLFTYSAPEDRCRTDHRFDMCYQLTTGDTDHETHVDSCVGNTINDNLRQIIALNSKGQLWKVSGLGGTVTPKRVGQIDNWEQKQIKWARCGIYPTNDCLVVALRDSVGMIDPRVSVPITKSFCSPYLSKKSVGGGNSDVVLTWTSTWAQLAGECSDLYTVSDGHPITDIQRFISNRSPHLRLINTTASMICLDDRKPNIPMLTVKHFRTHDLTLNMSFSAEPEWSPYPSYSLVAAAERFDNVLLWSRSNDVASLYQFKSAPGIPPAVLGYPSAVPVIPSPSHNPRAGMVFFRRPAIDHGPEKLCMVEMKRDGSLWHQQLGVFDSAAAPPSVHVERTERVVRYSSEASETDESAEKEKEDSEDDDDMIPLPTTTLQLDTICQDFTTACLAKPAPTDPTLYRIDLMDPLNFCMFPRTSAPWIAPPEEESPVIDLMPVLHRLLPASAGDLPDDSAMMDEDERDKDDRAEDDRAEDDRAEDDRIEADRDEDVRDEAERVEADRVEADRDEDVRDEDVRDEDVRDKDVRDEDVHVEDVQVEDVHVEDVQVEDVHVEDVQVEDVRDEDVRDEDVQDEDVQDQDAQDEDYQDEDDRDEDYQDEDDRDEDYQDEDDRDEDDEDEDDEDEDDKEEDDQDKEPDLSKKVAEILATAIKLSKKTPDPIGQPGEARRSECGSEDEEPRSSLAVDRMMQEWKLGVPTNDYLWGDICATTKVDTEQEPVDRPFWGEPPTHSRSQSRRNGTEAYGQQGRHGREDTVDVIQVVSRAGDRVSDEITIMTTPKNHPRKTRSTLRNRSVPAFAHPSASLPHLYPSNFQPATSQPVANPPSPPSSSMYKRAMSQVVPGPHATRSASTFSQARKKKRVGGF